MVILTPYHYHLRYSTKSYSKKSKTL